MTDYKTLRHLFILLLGGMALLSTHVRAEDKILDVSQIGNDSVSLTESM